MSGSQRPVRLGFVDLSGDSRPKRDEAYDLVPASGAKLEGLPFPEEADYRRLGLDLYSFYVENLPDFTSSNEGMIKIQVNTRNPQDLSESPMDATFVTEFEVRDGHYAPTFLSRGVFRNVLFQEWINLKVDLFELDADASAYYEKVKGLIDGVPEIKSLDVLAGIPYLHVATKLFDGIIRTFGKNPDDHIWGEFPTLELNPIIGGAFLRNGIYVLFEQCINEGKKSRGKNKGKEVPIESLGYRNSEVFIKDEFDLEPPNHLILGIRIRPHHA